MEQAQTTMTGTISAVVTRADGTVEDLGVISVVEIHQSESEGDD